VRTGMMEASPGHGERLCLRAIAKHGAKETNGGHWSGHKAQAAGAASADGRPRAARFAGPALATPAARRMCRAPSQSFAPASPALPPGHCRAARSSGVASAEPRASPRRGAARLLEGPPKAPPPRPRRRRRGAAAPRPAPRAPRQRAAHLQPAPRLRRQPRPAPRQSMDLSSLFNDDFLSDFELHLVGPGADPEHEAKKFPVHGAVLAGQRCGPCAAACGSALGGTFGTRLPQTRPLPGPQHRHMAGPSAAHSPPPLPPPLGPGLAAAPTSRLCSRTGRAPRRAASGSRSRAPPSAPRRR
jgi:hypothetical protein